MTATDLRLGMRAAELRTAFDRSFSEAPSERIAELENFLAIRVGSDPYAIRISEVSGLFADKVVRKLPSRIPALLGVAGLRGTILPVYDLGALLGYSPPERPRWLLLITANKPLGLAFDHFDGHLRVPRENIAVDERGEPLRYAREIVRATNIARPIVHIPLLLEEIQKMANQSTAQEEQAR